MKNYKLLSPYVMGGIELQNRVVMAPMTRSRALGNVPNDLMAEYYGQRSGAGLIITEGTSPSPDGLGYARIPGIFSRQQTEGWKKVTAAAHKGGAKIFLQLMHTGRIGHVFNLPDRARVISPSAVKAAGDIWTDKAGKQPLPEPEAMTADDIKKAKNEYVNAAKNAVEAGFDGVELHGANGYLLEQFLSPISNIRTDIYGGNIMNRSRFVLEVAGAVAEVIGREKTGIRLSPYGVASDMPHYPEIDITYKYLAEELNKIGLAYLHIVDHSAMGAPEVPAEIKKQIRSSFKGTVIISGGYDIERAEAALNSGSGDLVSFGRPFINNPDLPDRFRNGWSLSVDLDMNLFYTPGEEGYTNYPVHAG